MSSLAEHFSLETEDVPYPVNYKTIMQYKQNDKPLMETAELNKDIQLSTFMGQIRNILLFVESTKL